MKKVTLFLILLCGAVTAWRPLAAAGQWPERQVALVDGATVSPICGELAARGAGGATIEVKIEGSAAEPLRRASRPQRTSAVAAFTVSLARDNTQNARANIYAAAESFREAFPGIEVEVSYQAPWFNATAGRFVERADAVSLRGRALGRFPKAIVVQQEMSLDKIIEDERSAAFAAASPTAAEAE